MRVRLTSTFYVAGGCLEPGTPCYVERQADGELYEALLAGEFCYVLTARQMGKSSLRVRVAERLREAGIPVAQLDPTAFGSDATPEQWYYGLMIDAGVQLGMEDELHAFWVRHERLPPVARFIAGLKHAALGGGKAQSAESKGQPDPDPSLCAPCSLPGASRLVVFIDEIDRVRALPFPAHDLLEAIRECYNRRAVDPVFHRMAFCVLGAAPPSDLIRDTRLTPFNIGRRVELTDFTAQEAAQLSVGLEVGGPSAAGRPAPEARALLARILYWTGGQPYLTQWLCQAVLGCGLRNAECGIGQGRSGNRQSGCLREAEVIRNAKSVDRLCAGLFFADGRRESDEHLRHARDRLLRSSSDRVEVLSLYRRVWEGTRPLDDPSSAVCDRLKLSGVVRARGGRLEVRNRLYRHVFDRRWIEEEMPGAELRRQRTAYRRGVARAAAIAGVALTLVGGLAIAERVQARRAARWARAARLEARRADEQARDLRRNLYAADMRLAFLAWGEKNDGRALDLLRRQQPAAGQDDLRGWEWRYLWRQLHDDLRTLRGHKSIVLHAAFSSDGAMLATASLDRTVRLWNVSTGRLEATLSCEVPVLSVAFSPDGRFLAAGGGREEDRSPGEAWIWDLRAHGPKVVLRGHQRAVNSVAFSPVGRQLASGSWDGTVKLWEVPRGREVVTLRGRLRSVMALAFSPDGRTLASGGEVPPESFTVLWDVGQRREIATLRENGIGGIYALAFSPDGRRLAAGCRAGTASIWDVRGSNRLRTFQQAPTVAGVAFSPDGRTLATAGWDQTARLWNIATGGELAALRGHGDKVNAVAFSPDGHLLVTAGNDRTARLWRVGARPAESHHLPIAAWGPVFSPDGRLLAVSTNEQEILLRPAGTGQLVRRLNHAPDHLVAYAFSPDGRFLASVCLDGKARLWEVATGRVVWHHDGRRGGEAHGVAFSPDGRLVATSAGDDSVRIWDAATGGEVQTLRGHKAYAVAFSPDGKTLATGGDDSTTRLWDVATGALRAVLQGHGNNVYALAYSPDGQLLATGSWDRTLRLWDAATGRLLESIPAHQDGINCLNFSPDGRTLASGSDDRTLRLWNVGTRREVGVLAHASRVTGIAFSPDGLSLASGDADGVMRLWRAASLEECDRGAEAGAASAWR